MLHERNKTTRSASVGVTFLDFTAQTICSNIIVWTFGSNGTGRRQPAILRSMGSDSNSPYGSSTILSLTAQDRIEEGEYRWQTLGMVEGWLLLLVAHMIRDERDGSEVLWIISARRATPKERKRYEQEAF
jgi:uncharacterized DUF497 family protein